jgi:OOP family OmpA-OmpF porin
MPLHGGPVQTKTKEKQMKKTMFAVLAGVLSMGAAQAQTNAAMASADTSPQVYAGVSTGMVKDSISNDTKRTTKLFGGVDLDQNWAIEAGYTYLGKSGFWVSPEPNGLVGVSVKGYSAYAAAKYTMPLSERSSVYGKLGLSHSAHKYSGGTPGWNFTDSSNGLYAAAGLQYKLTEHVSTFVEYERYGKRLPNGPKNQVFNVGLKYGF